MATDLLNPLRNYLVTSGIVRKPTVAPPGGDPNRPPMWLEPRNGVPAPNEQPGNAAVEVGPDSVVAAFETTGIAPERHEGFIRWQHVDIRLRTTTAPRAVALKEAIRQYLNDRRGWMMDSLRVEESLLFRDWQRLGSDDEGFDYVAEFQFTLWGPPAVPETF